MLNRLFQSHLLVFLMTRIWKLFGCCCVIHVCHVVSRINLLGVVYHHLSASNALLYDHVTQVLDETSRQHPSLGIFLAGDFNHFPDAMLTSYPLQQIVKISESTLDKVFTNIREWYKPPVLLSAFGKSDHEAVLISPAHCPPSPRGFYVSERKRSGGQNGRVMLDQAVKCINWTSLLQLFTCESMVTAFCDTVHALLDYHLPWVNRTRYSTDKPWVTDQFRRLIKMRQRALEGGLLSEYKRLRNRTTAMGRNLRRRFYQAQVEQLHQSDSRNWWKHTKSFLNLNKSNSTDFSQLQYSENDSLSDVINNFFVSVSSHLSPLPPPDRPTSSTFLPPRENYDQPVISGSLHDNSHSEFIISLAEVEKSLSEVNVHKAAGPDGIPNWFLRDFAPF